jgi:glycosyltransferase involved in cell wall biosynthesis
MLKYVLVTSEYPPFFGGGIATYCKFLTDGLTANNCELTVVIPQSTHETRIVFQDNGVQIHLIDVRQSSKLGLHLTGFLLNSYAIWQYLENQIPSADIYEFIDYGAIGYFSLKNSKFKKSKLYKSKKIISSHGTSFFVREANGEDCMRLPDLQIRNSEIESFNLADLVIFPTPNSFNYMKEFLSPSAKIFISPHPFSLTQENLRILEDSPGHKYDAIFFGRLNDLKGFVNFVDRTSDLIHLKFAALGEDTWLFSKKMFASKYVKEKNSRILLFGKKRMSEIYKILKTGRLVVMPSKVEWFSYAYLEAIACGCFVLISRNTGPENLHELIDDTNTFFIEDLCENTNWLQTAIKNTNGITPKNYFSTHYFEFDPEIIVTKRLNEISNLPMRENSPTQSEISIVIPYFNAMQFIKETILSLSNSILKPKEIIVVDDGSDAKNAAYLNSLLAEYDFKIITKPNGGLSSARNYGLDHVKTELVLFLDSDDIIDKNYLTSARELLDTNISVSAAGCWVQNFGYSENIWETFNPSTEIIFYKNTVNSASLVWRSQAIRALNGFNEEMKLGFEDWELVARAISTGVKINIIDYPLFNYRTRINSMYTSMSLDTKRSVYQKYIYNLIPDSKTRLIVDKLIATHGPGWSYTNLLSAPVEEAESLVSNVLRNLSFKHPRLRSIWQKLPTNMKVLIFKLFMTAYKLIFIFKD